MNQQLNPVAMPGDTQFAEIADFILDPALQVPEEALAFTSTLLIDTLAVAAGATALKVAKIARDYAMDFMCAGSDAHRATMLFDGRKPSLPGAAWALATQIDNLDGHDGYNPVKGHIGVAVVPALMALAEQYPDLTGRDALTALTMSYEVGARAGLSLHATVSDYHTSGAWNALGVAAMACRLAGSDRNTLRQAMGIAEYHGPRSQMMREIDNPTMLHDGSGMGAYIGCSSAILAQRGFEGAPAITAEAAEVAHFWSDLGQNWTVAVNYIKPYPSCRWGHAAVDALRKLMREEGVNVDNCAHIEIRTFREAARLFAGVPETTSQAQYSINYVMALMLKHGAVAPEHIAEGALNDPEIAAIIPKISSVTSDHHQATFPEGRWSDIEVTLTDGRKLLSGDIAARGGPDSWMSDEEVREKFDIFCAKPLGQDRANAIWAMRDKLLEPGTKLSELAALVQAAAHG